MTKIFSYFFKTRPWDPTAIPGLGDWEPSYQEEKTVQTSKAGGANEQQPSALSLVERLKSVEAELKALEEALPDRSDVTNL